MTLLTNNPLPNPYNQINLLGAIIQSILDFHDYGVFLSSNAEFYIYFDGAA